MTAANAERTVAKSFATGEAEQRIAAAEFAGRLAAMNPIAFAEQVGEMLQSSLKGDLRMGQQAMLWVSIRKAGR